MAGADVGDALELEEEEDAYFSAEEEPGLAPPPRPSKVVRAIAFSRQRRHLEDSGRVLLDQIQAIGAAARARQASSESTAAIHAETVAFANRIIARTHGAAALRRLSHAVEACGGLTGFLPFDLEVEIGGDDCGPRGFGPSSLGTATSVGSSKWSSSSAAESPALPRVPSGTLTGCEEVLVAHEDRNDVHETASEPLGTSASKSPDATASMPSPCASHKAPASEASDDDSAETDTAATSSTVSCMPSRVMSRRGSSPVPALARVTHEEGADGATEDLAAPRIGALEGTGEVMLLEELDVALPPLKLEKRRRGRGFEE